MCVFVSLCEMVLVMPGMHAGRSCLFVSHPAFYLHVVLARFHLLGHCFFWFPNCVFIYDFVGALVFVLSVSKL